MKPWVYWLGWGLMATGYLLSLALACLYLGTKLDAILEVLRGR